MTKTTKEFSEAYAKLNYSQREAVETIDGPVLVLAGPGTGKTQLLSARVCNILQKTDVSPSNILCLTFTESGAVNMRERLRSFMGDEAYDVTISTYHSFGSDIIKNYSEYFQHISVDRSEDVRLERPIDELSQIQVVDRIVSQLPFDSQLLSARYYLKSVVKTISDLKKNLISPARLKEIGTSNLKQIDAVQEVLDQVVNRMGGISRKKAEWSAQYTAVLAGLSGLSGDLVEMATMDLKQSFTQSDEQSSSKPLTIWKNNWLHKNDKDYFTLTKRSDSEKMLELSKIYELYEKALRLGALYDFDDMILRAIEGITNNDELRYNLQERYQYILLDEFQDTNPSQFELVKKITDHPVHEGRPNVMAVGDDDQAIYAFQGASIGNLQDFLDTYRGVAVINLTHNYRSHKDVLHVAQNIAGQIKERIHNQLHNIDKILVESSKSLPSSAIITRHEFTSEAGEYSWVAEQISRLINGGTSPSEIVVLAPKHEILENMVPFLGKEGVSLTYEKRENILETEIVQGLHLSSKLLESLNNQDISGSNQYFPRALSLPYWQIPSLEIWRINWQLAKRDESRSWAEIALENPALSHAVKFYLSLGSRVSTLPLEIILDVLTGNLPLTDTGVNFTSPLKEYYFAKDKRAKDALIYYDSIIHLSVIRSHLRAYQEGSDHQLRLSDFLNFFTMYEDADSVLTNSHPVSQGKNAVQLMTAYKAKGLEFDHVFILQAHDEVWGSASRGSGSQLPLPPNLSHIRYVGSGDDERLRLFFVAITRARHGLYISSHTTKENGKSTTPLKYLGESGGISTHLPVDAQNIIKITTTVQELGEDIATLWSGTRIVLPVDFRDLLLDRLTNYFMSPTHLNSFMDMQYGGPEIFLMNTLLRFPSAPTKDSEYGVAIHNTLEWYGLQVDSGNIPSLDLVLAHYDAELDHRYLVEHDKHELQSRGRVALQKYLEARSEMFSMPAKFEVNFSGEGVVIGDARLTGKIDRLEIDKNKKTIYIVDYKTGKPLTKWDSSMYAYKYRHQLYFYKLLVEGSHTWKEYTVEGARLEFVEPLDKKVGDIMPALTIQFDDEYEAGIKQLIQVVWAKIQSLDLPQTGKYSSDVQGTKAFELDLLKLFHKQ